ncbi:MAG: EamA family transporter [Bacteroidota bacterium]|nr:EamA family transporter [Bacteroidota bacterium]
MIIKFISYLVLFSLSAAGSTTLMGDKDMLAGNLLSKEGILTLIMNWRFYLAIFLAILSRFTFVLMNSELLKIEYTRNNATNITTIVSIASIIVVFFSNYIFLNEWLTSKQFVGSVIILFGVWLVLTR